MQPEILAYFAKYIESELGIIYADHNLFQLENRLGEIAKMLGKPSVDALYDEAQRSLSPPFKQLLLDLSTNNETSFFRDAKVFTAIEDKVLKRFVGPGALAGPLRVWSAASSSGQEPLSLAMLIQEFAEKHQLALPFTITATDISEKILNRAKAGKYSQLEVQRGLHAKLMIKYFSKDAEDNWIAKEQLMKHISYAKQNLKAPFSFPQKFHVILCRNVLIYQNVEGKAEIVRRMRHLLEPGGHLILGAGESLLGVSGDFEQDLAEGTVLYRLKAGAGLAA